MRSLWSSSMVRPSTAVAPSSVCGFARTVNVGEANPSRVRGSFIGELRHRWTPGRSTTTDTRTPSTTCAGVQAVVRGVGGLRLRAAINSRRPRLAHERGTKARLARWRRPCLFARNRLDRDARAAVASSRICRQQESPVAVAGLT